MRYSTSRLSPAPKMQVFAKTVQPRRTGRRRARKLRTPGEAGTVGCHPTRYSPAKPCSLAGFDQSKNDRTPDQGIRNAPPAASRASSFFCIACYHDEPTLAAWLARDAGMDASKHFARQQASHGERVMRLIFPGTSRKILASVRQSTDRT